MQITGTMIWRLKIKKGLDLQTYMLSGMTDMMREITLEKAIAMGGSR